MFSFSNTETSYQDVIRTFTESVASKTTEITSLKNRAHENEANRTDLALEKEAAVTKRLFMAKSYGKQTLIVP